MAVCPSAEVVRRRGGATAAGVEVSDEAKTVGVIVARTEQDCPGNVLNYMYFLRGGGPR